MTTGTQRRLTPQFKWAQDMNIIYIKLIIDDLDANKMKLNVTRDVLEFAYDEKDAYGERKAYSLDFNFRFPVNPNTLKFKSFRSLELIIEKETSNAYWPHLLSKDDKKKYKSQCQIDWHKFLDEDEAAEAGKPIVDENAGYGNFGDWKDDDTSSDDSDDAPIDALEEEEEEEEDDDDNKIAATETEANVAEETTEEATEEATEAIEEVEAEEVTEEVAAVEADAVEAVEEAEEEAVEVPVPVPVADAVSEETEANAVVDADTQEADDNEDDEDDDELLSVD
jgi:hypothetical protein